MSYQLRVSKKAKYARITIKPSRQIEVVLPLGMPKREADKLIKQQQNWIQKTLARMTYQAPIKNGAMLPQYIDLSVVGEKICVKYTQKQSKPMVWQEEDKQLWVCCDKAYVPELLRGWLKAYAKNYLPVLLQGVAQEMGVTYERVSVRMQKTRWGSCSVSGNISLNAKLLLLPPDVARYVLVHELAHLRHMNHSQEFWQHVEQFEPNYRQRRQELKYFSFRLPAWTYPSLYKV